MPAVDRTWEWPLDAILRDARANAGLSKAAAANQAGISEHTWGQVENGYRWHPRKKGVVEPPRASDDTIRHMATAVGLDPDETVRLYHQGLRAAGKDHVETPELRPMAFYNQYRALSGPQQVVVRGVMDEFTRANEALARFAERD